MNFNTTYTKLICLVSKILFSLGVPHSACPCYDGAQLRFEWADNADVICHSGSYGHEKLHVETMGFPWDEDDVTELDAYDFIMRVYHLYAASGQK